MPSRSSNSSQILGVCVRKLVAYSIAGGLCVKIADTEGGA